MAIPYFNPTFAAAADAPEWRVPGRPRPVLAHFRGRVMNRVRGTLVRRYGGASRHIIEAAHPSPLSVTKFRGCKCFSKANQALVKRGMDEVDWSLDP